MGSLWIFPDPWRSPGRLPGIPGVSEWGLGVWEFHHSKVSLAAERGKCGVFRAWNNFPNFQGCLGRFLVGFQVGKAGIILDWGINPPWFCAGRKLGKNWE